ncbi:MAG: hypothetical protein P0Y62_08385 [Candidatus Chryseobacterium colombiense]|nr:hypothetical protein [Chryseobacterium sp.]WEK71570.1 MAG: hypothetical protein P0Y62_08385 [Chryseobacterium sp.]
MAKDFNILNTGHFNILQKISFGEKNMIIFYFGDIPDWKKKEVIKDVVVPSDDYEVVEITFNLNYNDLADLYWKLNRYCGEEMFLQLNDDAVNFWEGEVTDFKEYWGTFDDLEENIPIVHHKKYTAPKSSDDWKRDYESLRARYYILYNELLSLKEKNE